MRGIGRNQSLESRHYKSSLPIWLFFGTFVTFGLLNGFYREAAFAFAPSLYWALDAIHFVGVPVLFSFWLSRYGWRAEDFGLDPNAGGVEWFDFIVAGVFLYLVLLVVYQAYAGLGYALFGDARTPYFFTAATPVTQPMRAIGALYKAISAGVAEEFVFKGLFTPALVRYGKSPAKILLLAMFSASTFSAIHWENGVAELFGTWCYGFISFLFYTRFEALTPFILAHSGIDVYHFW